MGAIGAPAGRILDPSADFTLGPPYGAFSEATTTRESAAGFESVITAAASRAAGSRLKHPSSSWGPAARSTRKRTFEVLYESKTRKTQEPPSTRSYSLTTAEYLGSFCSFPRSTIRTVASRCKRHFR